MLEGNVGREMTLKEVVDKLPGIHRAHKEFVHLTQTIGLLNSMLISEEQHSEQSAAMVEKAQNILNGIV